MKAYSTHSAIVETPTKLGDSEIFGSTRAQSQPRRRARLGLALLLSVFLGDLAVQSHCAAQELTAVHGKIKSVALVVGNSAYPGKNALPNPANDAQAVDTALRELGFATVLLLNGTLAAMTAAVDEFLVKTRDAETILFYFAGHGVQLNGDNFLAPIDFTVPPEGPPMRHFLSFGSLLDKIVAHAPASAAKILILDACRESPLDAVTTRPDLEITRGLARVELPVRRIGVESTDKTVDGYFRIVAFATQPGDVAEDGDSEHSPYTRSLIKHIRQPGIEAADMFRRIAADVLNETGGKQKPSMLIDTSRTVFFRLPNITECDRFAIEGQNFLGIKGVPFDDVNPSKAIPACEEAVRAQPDSARLHNNLGRAYEKSQRLKDSLVHYAKASDAGYPPAINALGIMYLAGCGLPRPDVETGVKLIARANNLGNLSARATLTSHDLLPHVDEKGIRRLQEALKKAGDYTAAIDGRAGPQLKRSLAQFQKRQQLAGKGLTLETVHKLGVYEIVPEGFRCH
jgi:tetratricopeptide (TPR) repeat protein